MIRIKKLSKFFDRQQVLKDVDLSIDEGKVYGIVGQNGAGKTTLFRCLAGLESFHGEIESKYTPLKNHLGFLQTEPYFLSKLTGREYIQLLGNARDIKIESIDQANVFDLPLDQYASTYSTGMKKKLAITAVLVQKNQVYIFDEPYNGVDIQSNILISEIFARLRAANRTLIISSHIFSTLEQVCDEIFLLHQGEIIKRVIKDDFKALEEEMKEFVIGNKLDNLSF